MFDVWIILTASLVAMACSFVGCFLVLRKMAMIGDAISHAVLPGIVITFLISGSRGSFWMLLAAAVVGLLAVFIIQWMTQLGLQSDASIGVVFTSFFALGVLLVSVYSRQIDLDLDCVLYGEIAFVPWNTIQLFGYDLGPKAIWLVGFAFLLSILVVGLCYKQFKITSFDPAMAATLGIPVMLFHYALMSLVSVTTVASFESVGAILVVGMLIVPASAAYLCTEKLHMMIFISMGIGVLSAVIGYGVASWFDVSIAGSMIAVAGVIFMLALALSPSQGLLVRRIKQRRRKQASIHVN